MRWDDCIFTGTHEGWSWLVVRAMVRELPAMTTAYHQGQRLCITAFDSGSIEPSPEERKVGWTMIDGVMVSPPLTPDTDLPCDGYDEWYIFSSLPTKFDFMDRYVNYEGFNLACPHALAESQDPTWDRKHYDWLGPLQQRFWEQMHRAEPTSYVASGAADIVVTRHPDFFRQALHAASESLG